MKMIRVTNRVKTISTTPKMFEAVYRAQGFALVKEEPEEPSPENELSGVSIGELRALAKEKGIPNAGKMKLPDLIAALTPKEDNKVDTGQPAGGEENGNDTGEPPSGNEATA